MSNIKVGGDAEMKGSAFGNENQIASEIEKVGGNFVQASDSDVHIGNKISGDRNVNVLGNLTIYLSSRSVEPDEKPEKTDIGPNPYKGLSAFSEEDTERFFGRDELTTVLYEKFCALHDMPPEYLPTDRKSFRLLAILGPSGSGKSSVARAGLLQELARNPLPGKQHARVAVLTPGSHPLRALAAILARIATNDPVPVAKTREFEEELRMTPPCPPQGGNSESYHRTNSPLEGGQGGVFDGLSRVADVLPDIRTAPLIVLVDQFEEVFSLCQDAGERQQFIGNLLTAASDPSNHVSIILTLRSDFLGHTQSFPNLNHVIAKQGVIVPVMNDAELREAIAKPAELAGHPLDDATIDLLIAQSAGREGALPLLQFALTRIWEGLAEGVAPADTLKNIGGVGGALAGEAQRLYEKLSDEDKAIARRAFLALVQLGEGTQDTRRRAAVPEIIAHDEDPDHVAGVLRLFAQPGARLVSLSADSESGMTAEVTHEALLSHWASLKEWLNSSRDDLRFHRRLAEAANYWEEQQQPDGLLWRPPDLDLLHDFHARAKGDMTPVQMHFFNASVRREKHSKRLKRAAITALTIFALVAGIATYFAVLSRNEAIHFSLVQWVLIQAEQHFFKGEREQAALLARQASLLNDLYQSSLDDQIREVLRGTLVQQEGEIEEMIEQVCQQATRNLTPDEWQDVVKSGDVAYQPCPGLPGADGAGDIVLRLRSDPMTTEQHQHLSLYVKANQYVGTFVDNHFEAQGEVIVDHATGLMWQQSGSEEELTYEEAQKYVKRLNDEKFAGYGDWRLPTVEELVSLVEPEEQNDVYIDPMFDSAQWWVWSADLYQRKGESGSSSTAWGVNFDDGSVGWYNLGLRGCVRCVRS